MKGLGHRYRLDILKLAGLFVANGSQHLRLMRHETNRPARRAGKHILYGLSDPAVLIN